MQINKWELIVAAVAVAVASAKHNSLEATCRENAKCRRCSLLRQVEIYDPQAKSLTDQKKPKKEGEKGEQPPQQLQRMRCNWMVQQCQPREGPQGDKCPSNGCNLCAEILLKLFEFNN